MEQIDLATAFAIIAAKQAGVDEVTPDHILLGCLRTISRYGIASIGEWILDLETLGVDWVTQPSGPRPKVRYSQAAVDLFDLAAKISKSLGDPTVGVNHLLAAFSADERGLMGELKRKHGITSATWRTAVSRLATPEPGAPPSPASSLRVGSTELPAAAALRDYLTTEEAAEALGVHVQTMRAYIRQDRLPAFRLAGERSIRILRADLEKVLEPLKAVETKGDK